MAEEHQFHFAGYDDAELMAILILVPITESRVKMRQVAIAPEYRGKGRGQHFVRQSEYGPSAGGFSKMELHARELSSRFYAKLGYRIEGDSFEEVGLPHFKMTKNL